MQLDRPAREQNKALFDTLYSKKDDLEKSFGNALAWRRMDDKKVSIIEYAQQFGDGHSRANWPDMTAWLVEHTHRLEQAFNPEMQSLRNALRIQFPKEPAA